MADAAIDKFVSCVRSGFSKIDLHEDKMLRVLSGLKSPDMGAAKISVGPTSVLESSVRDGGGTGFLSKIC